MNDYKKTELIKSIIDSIPYTLQLNNNMTDLRNAVLELHPNLPANELEALTLYGIEALNPTRNTINTEHRTGTKGTNCN
ncbi:hypothetical protein [Roseivirga sp.]|jgi:hypothetical protein|uniref:hypothetical protein n=2 Tax=Roseivirgaceae TaxID=2762306 RepID=UPI000D795D79|nr:hypothetical protein [Roseivirga sp.]MBO6494174.1 hypothetical protein [Roseivirga sp.]PWL29719.1 MAG: hypothetical protein DCO95_07695 [Roseivirga sp. XM-24bin3]